MVDDAVRGGPRLGLEGAAVPAWVGLWYEIFGARPTAVGLVQALLAPLTVALTFLLGRRLFDMRIGLIAACVVAVFPLAWEF